ncbi:MAG: hypothetical protein H7256_04140 [Bdellovibrio sp.]|nr:hypothetical protein [Bdellovibrio sp.]
MSRTTTQLVSFLITLTCAYAASAEVFRWPQGCLTGDLEVVNLTHHDVSGWVQTFKPNLVDEANYLFNADSKTKIKITAKTASEFFSLLTFEKNQALKVTYLCDTATYPAHTFEGGVLTYRKSELPENKLWLQNLYPDANTFQLEFLNRSQEVLVTTSISLNAMEQISYKTPGTVTDWSYVRIRALQRYAAFNITPTGSEGPFIIDTQKTVVDDTVAYFVVAARDNSGDQFIIQVTNDAMIAKAREQITNPTLEKIVFARIQKGNSGFNRNWSKKEKPLWSWSTAEVTNISDIGSTACNGFPQAVEDRVESWSKDPGRICFWSYRIKKELTPAEVAAGQQLQ